MELKITIALSPETWQAIHLIATAISSNNLQVNQMQKQPSTPNFVPRQPATNYPQKQQQPPQLQPQNLRQAQPVQAQTTLLPISKAPQYTLEQIMSAAVEFMENSQEKQGMLQNVLKAFGVASAYALKPEDYEAAVTEMRKIGVRI